jgi:DUF1365 family protein
VAAGSGMVAPGPAATSGAESPMPNPCLWSGCVRLRRHDPLPLRSAHRQILVGLEPEGLEEHFPGRWFWSSTRMAPFRLRREDHFGDPRTPIADSVRELVASRLGFRPLGPIHLITQPRCFGLRAAPVSLHLCYPAAHGAAPEAVVVEFRSRRMGERHVEVLDLRRGDPPPHPKALHLSPFLPMDIEYRWHFAFPPERLFAAVEGWRQGRRILEVELDLVRVPFETWTAASLVLRQPFTAGGLHLAFWRTWILLGLRGAPFYPHPRRRGLRMPPPAGSGPL